MIFARYEVYQSRMEEIKGFITAKHPDLKVWFQYNRINMKLESESEIARMFFTVREAVTSFHLI